jgi:HAD superfamily hydrolase (TIGR01490 family)
VSASVAAFFDVDGTITKTNLIKPLLWYQAGRFAWPRFLLAAAAVILRGPYYLWIDRRSRSQFNAVFYRRYAGLPVDDLRAWHQRTFAKNLYRTIFTDALDCVRAHQQQCHRVILVTGGLDFVMRPLADFLRADDLIATQLVEHQGVFTGELIGLPIGDEHKATLVRDLAGRRNIDLAQSFAYGDSIGDAPMLECVGHPVAVSSDRRLRRLARQRGWQTLDWRK